MLRRQQLSVFINVACTGPGIAQTSLSQLPWPLTRLIITLTDEHFAIIKKKRSESIKRGTRKTPKFWLLIAVYTIVIALTEYRTIN